MDEELKIKQKMPIEAPKIDVEETVGIEASSYFSDQMVQVKSKREPAPQEITVPVLEKPTEEAVKKKVLSPEDVRATLSKDVRLDSVIRRMSELTGKSSDEYIKEILSHLSSSGIEPSLAPQAIFDALVKMLTEMGAQAPASQQKEIASLLDSVKINRLFAMNSDFKMVAEILKNEYEQEGVSVGEAEKKANVQALQMMQTYLEENFEKNLQTASSSEIQQAAASIIKKKFPNLDPIASVGLFTGMITAKEVTSSFFSHMAKVADIPPKDNRAANWNTLGTVVKQGEELVAGAKTVLQTMNVPMSDKEKAEAQGFMGRIADLLQELSSFLLEMQMLDARKGHESAVEERKLLEQKFHTTLDKLVKEMEAATKSASLNKFLSIFTNILGALATLLGVVFMPVTGGASIAIFIGVSATLFAASTALSCTGVLNKAFENLGKVIEESLEKSGKPVPEALKSFVKFLAFAAIVAVTVVASVAARRVDSVLVRLIANTVCTEVLTHVITSSNVVGHLVESIGKAAGWSNEAMAIISMIFTIVATLGVAGLSLSRLRDDLELASKMNIVNPIISSSEKLQKIAPIFQAGTQSLQAASSVFQGVMGVVIAKIQLDAKEMEAILELLKYIQKIVSDMGKGLKADSDTFNQMNAMVTEVFNSLIKGQKRSLEKIYA